MSFLLPLEILSLTPNEVEKPNGKIGNVMPEPFLMPTDDERLPGAFFSQTRVATPTEARANKCVALSTDPKTQDDRAQTIVEVPVEECKHVSRLFRDAMNLQQQLDDQDGAHVKLHAVHCLGETRVLVHGQERTVDVLYGDETPFHASHVSYRMKAYPNPAGKVTTNVMI